MIKRVFLTDPFIFLLSRNGVVYVGDVLLYQHFAWVLRHSGVDFVILHASKILDEDSFHPIPAAEQIDTGRFSPLFPAV